MDFYIRKKIRLKDYDYSQAGCYFITICVKDRQALLGSIPVGAGSTRPSGLSEFAKPQVELSENGHIVRAVITQIPMQYPSVYIDHYVVMPNHIHLILVLKGAGRVDPAPTVSNIMGWFKYKTTKESGIRGIWQRSYHDRIVRDESEHIMIWQYIDENPARWTEDRYFVAGKTQTYKRGDNL